ncbi:MAG: hypothetical protein ACREHV_02675 [Rhizomicrobium sp.]
MKREKSPNKKSIPFQLKERNQNTRFPIGVDSAACGCSGACDSWFRFALPILSIGLLCVAATSLALADSSQASTDAQVPLKHLSLEQLGNVEVTSVSKEPEEV